MTAARTGMPSWTCLWILDWFESAVCGCISRPRFIGPGWRIGGGLFLCGLFAASVAARFGVSW